MYSQPRVEGHIHEQGVAASHVGETLVLSIANTIEVGRDERTA